MAIPISDPRLGGTAINPGTMLPYGEEKPPKVAVKKPKPRKKFT